MLKYQNCTKLNDFFLLRLIFNLKWNQHYESKVLNGNFINSEGGNTHQFVCSEINTVRSFFFEILKRYRLKVTHIILWGNKINGIWGNGGSHDGRTGENGDGGNAISLGNIKSLPSSSAGSPSPPLPSNATEA